MDKKDTRRNGFLILDRKGEYIEDTLDQRENTVFGLHHHPRARERMVVVSNRDAFAQMQADGLICDHLKPQFGIKDIEPTDLADFLPGLTERQADLLRDYAHTERFYDKLLNETTFGAVDNRRWYEYFPGLFDLKDKGKELVKAFEKKAEAEGRGELTDEERDQLHAHLGGTSAAVLERAAGRIKRFCGNPYFGGSARGRIILQAPSCVDRIVRHLEEGRFVFIDMRGHSDEHYTMVAALFARRLLNENKRRDDASQIRACMVMEEAHNILSEEELSKGDGRGSVFIELAREGRSFKLGFILVTQQPDARSIAPQIVKTIDTVVAFNMPPEDAKHLQRLKSGFADLELSISNAKEFQGVAIANAGPVFFQSAPVDDKYMIACADGSLPAVTIKKVKTSSQPMVAEKPAAPHNTLEERIAMLNRQRQESIEPIALATMRAWRADGELPSEGPRPRPEDSASE